MEWRNNIKSYFLSPSSTFVPSPVGTLWYNKSTFKQMISNCSFVLKTSNYFVPVCLRLGFFFTILKHNMNEQRPSFIENKTARAEISVAYFSMLSHKAVFLFISKWFINVNSALIQAAWFITTYLVMFQFQILSANLQVLRTCFK